MSYGVGHRIRIEVLALLNEETRSPSELAKLTRQPITTIGHHIKELVNSGCIELARIEKVRNVDQHFYRAVELPFISDEEAEDLPFEARQEYAAVILQALMAEGLAGALGWQAELRSGLDELALVQPRRAGAAGGSGGAGRVLGADQGRSRPARSAAPPSRVRRPPRRSSRRWDSSGSGRSRRPRRRCTAWPQGKTEYRRNLFREVGMDPRGSNLKPFNTQGRMSEPTAMT